MNDNDVLLMNMFKFAIETTTKSTSGLTGSSPLAPG